MADESTRLQQALLDSLSGGHIPRRPTAEEQQATAELERQYQELGGWRRAMAGIGNIVGSMPLIRSLPGVDRISTPEDLRIAREARPFLSGVEQTYGHTLPYLALGFGPYIHSSRGELVADIPPILFGSIPRSAVSTSGIEALDAYGAGEDVQSAAIRGAMGGGISSLLGKAITPRSLEGALGVNARSLRDMEMLRAGTVPRGLSSRLNPLAYERRGALGNEFAVSPADKLAFTYGTNTILPLESRALLNALASGGTQGSLRSE